MKMFGWLTLLCSLVIMPVMAAEALTGPVILKVGGNISSADEVDGKVLFDLAKLQALPQHEIVTGNPGSINLTNTEAPNWPMYWLRSARMARPLR